MSSLYHSEILNLSRRTSNAGVLPNAPAAKKTNAWCGDECLISAAFDNGNIVRALHKTRGCILCLAAAAKATEMAMQLGDSSQVQNTIADFNKMMCGEDITLKAFSVFAPVIAAKNRRACVLLPFLALAEVIQIATIKNNGKKQTG